MSDLNLTEEELVKLTRRKQPCAQARVLAQLGVPFQRHPVDGHCVVWRHDAPQDARLAGWAKDEPSPAWEETALGTSQKAERERQEAAPKPSRQQLDAAAAFLARRRKEARAALVRFHAARRRVVQLQRTPPWADQAKILEVYQRARQLTDETGVMHHVDHEIPLQGALVSGLHVHNNLQILTASENSRKRNRYEIEL